MSTRAKRTPKSRSAAEVKSEEPAERIDDKIGIDDEEDNVGPRVPRHSLLQPSNGTSPHVYRAGAIMHMSLRNFITYDRIDVAPGPHMNMIIGPNGTGKSSIVCAIALGLGENTSVMKRAKDISEFVKHGHAHGSIEITLATGEAGGGGAVRIRREIHREGNRSAWRIDGRAATFGEVQRRTRELRIQVNNLCQFLPQDRVVEFSKMTPPQLLKQTQAAVGRDDLAALQAELVKQRAEERRALGEAQRLRSDADALRQQNAVLERDVQRWQERQAAESQLRVLEALVPLARYHDAKDAYDAAKQTRAAAHAHYQHARTAAGPAQEEIDALEAAAAAREQARRRAGEARAGSERGARQQLARLERLEAAQAELRTELAEVKTRAQRRRAQADALRAEVAALEAEAARLEQAEPAARSDDVISAEARSTRERKLELSNELVRVQDEKRALLSSGRQAGSELERVAARLRSLDDVAARRREALRRVSEDTVRALEWLEANRGLFAQHVFAPVCLEATVRDARFASLIESVVSAGSLRTFVAQSAADYHTFTREVNDRQRLRVDVVGPARDLDAFRAPQPRDALRELGFDGYALDFIDAPRPVLAALCARDSVHEVPLALGAVDHAAAEARMLFREYVSDSTRYTVARGRYGSRAASVTTSRTRASARLLGAGDSDDVRAQRERLGADASRLRDQQSANEARMKRLTHDERVLRDEHRAADAREQELRDASRRAADAAARRERHAIHIESKRAQLASLAGADASASQRQQQQADTRRIDDALRANARDRAAALAACAESAAAACGAIRGLAAAGLAAHGDARALGELRAAAARHRDAIDDAAQAFERADAAWSGAKAHVKACLAESQAAARAMSDAEKQATRDALEQRRDASCADVEAELATCRQRIRLAAASGLSAGVVAQHAERMQRLAALVAAAQDEELALQRIRRHKKALRERWEQPLADAVARINTHFRAMFDRIACLGEVALARAGDGAGAGDGDGADAGADDEDYDAWGIDIRVAFRAAEALQPLDSHRQSGGERAVATILYLQALQALVAAPFRVVDEINQGMDERNERLVHSLIVDSACQHGSSQYFLITPKLLPDLDYHPLMRVLCIFNGEWQPEAFNFGKYITNARRQPV
ncbi:Structural maintenance of chromosomes protein 5 [Coemansia sp. RSA 2322]|nr:Structural maintenance of chromosomes protein 5 [Coemansia sp. RSA 2322]